MATGGEPSPLPGIKFGERVLTSNDLFKLRGCRSLIIIGGGVIGVEIAAVMRTFGVDVTIIERGDRLIAREDEEVSGVVAKSLMRDGVNVIVDSKTEEIVDGKVKMDGKTLEADKIFVAVGRRPVVAEGADKLGVAFDGKKIVTDAHMKTNVPHIYAIGDVAGAMLAHVASHEGIVAAENIMGRESAIDRSATPYSIFSIPEVSTVGVREGKEGKFPFVACPKAVCMGDTVGFVKVWVKDGRIVGSTIVGPRASDLITEATLAIRMKISAEDVVNTMHPHPTLPEAFMEAVRAALDGSIHLP